MESIQVHIKMQILSILRGYKWNKQGFVLMGTLSFNPRASKMDEMTPNFSASTVHDMSQVNSVMLVIVAMNFYSTSNSVPGKSN